MNFSLTLHLSADCKVCLSHRDNHKMTTSPHTHTHGRIFQMPVLPNMHGLRRRVNWGDIKLSGLLDIPFKKSTKGEIPLTLPTLLCAVSLLQIWKHIYIVFNAKWFTEKGLWNLRKIAVTPTQSEKHSYYVCLTCSENPQRHHIQTTIHVISIWGFDFLCYCE